MVVLFSVLIRNLGFCSVLLFICFFFQAEDGIRDLVRSRGLGDVYKRQIAMAFNAASGSLDAMFTVPSSLTSMATPVWSMMPLSLIHI